MSVNTLFNSNDYVLHCDTMHCKNMVPPTPGSQGDIYTVNAANQSIFSKTFEGSGQEYLFKNCRLEVCNVDDTMPGIIAACTQSTSTQGAVIGIGESDTGNSWFHFYDVASKNLGLGQNLAATNKDYQINCGTGNLIVNNKLKLPTVAANSFVKIDNSNVLVDTLINLDDLDDVVITGPTNGQGLIYNSGTTKWENQSLPADTVSSVFGRTGAVIAQEGDYSLTQLSDVTLAGVSTNQILNYDGANWGNSNTSMYREKLVSNNSTFTASLDNIYIAPGGTVTLPSTGLSDQGRRVLLATANSQTLSVIFPVGSFLMNTGQSNFTINSSNGGIELVVVSANQWVAIAIGGNWNNIASTGLISIAYNGSPGAYNITVPTGAKTALISAVGGGGSGANAPSVNGLGGGGAGGAIVDYPIAVSAGQTISIVVGTGGADNNTNGTDTTINMGTFTITCTGGQCGQIANPTGVGGLGGSVILPFATTAGGLGGIASVGANGGIGVFAYSGAGGGSGTDGGTSFAGGANLLHLGGTGNSRQGGGGASAFANGGSYNVAGGTLGSGGPANVNNIKAGGDGFVSISFYSN